MAGPLLDLAAVITCPHGGQVQPATANATVLVDGVPALLVGDAFPVTDCPFSPAGAEPGPCAEVAWTAPAERVLVDGRAVLLSTSTGECMTADGLAQGSPSLSGDQPRVVAQ